MMKTLLAVLLLSAMSVLAQDQPASPHKSVSVTKRSLPVSQYLRQIGILYLETINDLAKDCSEPHSDLCSAATDRWDSTMAVLEDRVNITLSQPRRPAGDAPFWELLQHASFAKHMYLMDAYLSRANTKWLIASDICPETAHRIALDGEYFSDGGCRDAIDKAVIHPPLPPPPSAELRAKCLPFADGSVDKVLANTMPLPPKECREALGWMRDARLSTLYDGNPKQ
ncbi:MAG: hypothetical protein ABSF71_35775 [Terriglobia bacterium]|jgi:hypothetical protein